MLDSKLIHDRQNEISISIIAALEREGYVIRPTKTCLKDKGWHNNTPDWNASHTERGVRIAISQRSRDISGLVKLRTEIGTVKVAADFRIHQNIKQPITFSTGTTVVASIGGSATFRDSYLTEMGLPINGRVQEQTLDQILDWMRELRGQDATKKLRSKADLEPLNFKTEAIALQNIVAGSGAEVRIHHFLKSCVCVDIVAINDKLQVSQEGISTPDVKCWFLIRGKEKDTGDRVKIIVNSEITRFHPVIDRNTQKFKGLQVTNNVRPENGKIDYTTFSVLDQQAVRMAIEHYLRSHGIAE